MKHHSITIPSLTLLALLAGCASTKPSPQPPPPAAQVIPPAMPPRAIARGEEASAGQTTRLQDREYFFTLFLPNDYRVPPNGEVELTMHFHGATWFAIQEHLRAGLAGPLLIAELGQGSTVYRRPFEDPRRFSRLLSAVVSDLQRRGAPASARISAVNVSSFSAGYGAVREIVRSSEHVKLIRRIVLCDSLYASFAPGTTDRPAKEHIDAWLPFARLAAQGQKTFVLTYSDVPTPAYASTAQCAAALVQAVGAPMLTPIAHPAPTPSEPYPLVTRSDVNGFHVWGYAGADAQAHMTHVRHLAEVWKALDAARQP